MDNDRMNRMVNDQVASINQEPTVKITELEDDQILVEGKLVYQDQNNKWIAAEELTRKERKALRGYLAGKIQGG